MPTIAVICRPWTRESRSPSGSKSSGSMSLIAAAMMRRPLPPRRSISGRRAGSASSPQRDGLALGQGRRGPPDDGRGGALDEDPDDGVARGVLGVAEGGHELVGGVERQRREPGVGLLGALDVDLRLVPEDQQRALGRVADDLAVDELGVVGDEEGQDRRLDGVGVAGGVLDLAVEAVAHAGDRVAVGRVDHLDDGDLVHRERAGLVRVDRRGGAQGLHRVEALHDGAVGGELARTAGQDHLQHGRHGHRDGGQRQRDRGGEDGLRSTRRGRSRGRT